GNPAPYLEFHKLKWIFDAVYIPAETQFIAQAKKNNLMIISGIELFVFQGVEAFLTFSNKESLRKDVYSKIDNLLNLYLKKLS
ncbi:MAG: shikimate dehydrogenase, partial [Pelagibacteraceae bacterium]|nr:shikimate dehydrogenase [Pelagibacteraceae bacterium]